MRASSVVRPTNAARSARSRRTGNAVGVAAATPSRSASASCCVSCDGPVRRRVTSRLRSSRVLGEGGAAIAGGVEPAHERAMNLLRQRLECGLPTGQRNRLPQLAVPCGGGRQLLEQRDEAVAVLVLRLERPFVVEPGKEWPLEERERLVGVPGGAEALGLEDVDPRVGREADPVASRDERVLAECAAQRPERTAQARARAVVENVGPEDGGDRRSRLRARPEGEPAQQRAGPSRRERTAFTVDLSGDLADQSQPQHRQSVTRSC